MKWLLIGQLFGSLVTSEHDNREACEGRLVVLREKGVSARCIEPQSNIGISTGTTYWCGSNGVCSAPVR